MTCKERGWVRPTMYQGMYNAISESNPTKSLLTSGTLNGSLAPLYVRSSADEMMQLDLWNRSLSQPVPVTALTWWFTIL